MKQSIFLALFCTPFIMYGLPLEIIQQKGDYLKGLITQVKLEQFKKDSESFFEFDPEFPPTAEAMSAYTRVADELVEHAKVTRREKFEERKLLLGTIIHNMSGLFKSITCGIICAATALAAIYCTVMVITRPRNRAIATIIAIVTGLISFGCGRITKKYWTHAINKAEVITQEMKMLNEIIDHCKGIQQKMHP